jgi:hypothetical protein
VISAIEDALSGFGVSINRVPVSAALLRSLVA